METLLNLAWTLLVAVAFFQWLRAGVRNGANPRVQLLALAMIVLILFPVVSVTDDLQAALNPAESDCCLRRDHECFTPHSIVPALAAMLEPVSNEFSFGIVNTAVADSSSTPIFSHPELDPIENRPPPAARSFAFFS